VTDYDATTAAAGCHLPIAYLAAAIPICDLIQSRSLIPHLLTAETLEQLVERLIKKFSIKNTTGYHMGVFLDESTPLGIFRKLWVGSEGTLAFISEGVVETVPDDESRHWERLSAGNLSARRADTPGGRTGISVRRSPLLGGGGPNPRKKLATVSAISLTPELARR
jgi:hypothetical protein